MTPDLVMHPVLSWPRMARAGQRYLLTVDLRPAASDDPWPYSSEEIVVHCLLRAGPLFTSRPIGTPALVVHRFGGTYGRVSFVLTARAQPGEGTLTVTLVNDNGVAMRRLELDNVQIITDAGGAPAGEVERRAEAAATTSYDLFLSYARSDRKRAVELRDALVLAGLSVWLDDEIESFASISEKIGRGLARCRALVALYSTTYATRRACQWELTVTMLADPARVLVVNGEDGVAHIEPQSLRDGLCGSLPAVGDAAGFGTLAARVGRRIAGLEGALGAVGVGALPRWCGRRPVAAERFVGRETALWAIDAALTVGEVGMITGAMGDPALQLVGMGGVGKSLLAEEYALRFGTRYPGGVFWLRAFGHGGADEHPETLTARRDTQMLSFARDLGVEMGQLAPEQVAAAVATHLDEAGEPFLWIVDDLPGDLDRDALEAWLAPGRCGRSLLTTRSRSYAALGRTLDVGVLSDDEGLELLLRRRTPSDEREWAAAAGLVTDLGGHALALDVAGNALAATTGFSGFARYRAELAKPSGDELELAARLGGELPSGHESSIATTLARSIRQLDDAGIDLLRLASRLAVQPIASTLVADVFAHVDGLDEQRARERAIAGIHGAAVRSLADRTDGTFTVHTLVSRSFRLLERRADRTNALADSAVAALTSRLHAALEGLADSDDAMVSHARQLATPPSDASRARLLGLVAIYDYNRGDISSAQRLQEQTLAVLQRIVGDEDSSTVTVKGNLALTLRARGDSAAARALQEQVLSVRRRVLGTDHPDTLTAMASLALTLRAQADLTGARALQEQVLTARRRVLAADHPDTLTAMANLAGTLIAQGDHAEARDLQEEVVSVRRRVFGDDHPDTLTAMSNLAATLGDHEAARALDAQALTMRGDVLDHPGSSDPETAYRQALDNDPTNTEILRRYALFLTDVRGEHDRARELYQRAVVADPNNVDVLSSYARFSVERAEDAAATEMIRRALVHATEGQDALRAELWMYLFALGPRDQRTQARRELAALLEAGVRVPHRDFSGIVARAIEMGHEDRELLSGFVSVIGAPTDEAAVDRPVRRHVSAEARVDQPIGREHWSAPLSSMTTMRLGGPARRLVEPTTESALIAEVRQTDLSGQPLLILGGGSNVIVADDGFDGAVVRIQTRGIDASDIGGGRVRLDVAAGESWDAFVAACVDQDLAGVEAMSGIPGSVGAAPIQNVGAYGQQVADVIRSVRVLDRIGGEVRTLEGDECLFAYQRSVFKRDPGRWLVLSVQFELERGRISDPVRHAELAARVGVEDGSQAPLAEVRAAVLALRRAKGMLIDPEDPDSISVGSFFMNPVLDLPACGVFEERVAERLGRDVKPPVWPQSAGEIKTSAAWLIERAGFTRGYGNPEGIAISHKHTLVLTNRGAGTTAELIGIARAIAAGVHEAFGLHLVPAPVFVGLRWSE